MSLRYGGCYLNFETDMCKFYGATTSNQELFNDIKAIKSKLKCQKKILVFIGLKGEEDV